MALMGSPYWCSLVTRGRDERRSYSKQCPLDVPTPYVSPSRSYSSAVTWTESL
jgi:hypothetical protein